ncbi:MAG: efflux RND transporter permease subunit [Verrucomicrobia bacterium]|jgi:CzcA family heavy metal efflux pump|nr:efflux RND transporter permease subunit [Verrucomicrobiota bacterium]
MFDRLIQFSLRNRLFVVAFAALVMAYGGYILTKLPVDVFPDLNRPTVTIFAEAEGLAPEEIETLVTFPIETAMNGATGVQRVRSNSSVGLSLVFVEFDWNTDIYLARQIVTEKLQQVAAQLPANAKPVLGPISSIMGEIMLVGLTSENPKVTSMDLRSIADWQIRQRLLSISGIAQITVIGGDLKQYQILVDPYKLQHYGVSLHDVQEAAQNANVNATGGFLLRDYTEGLIRNLARVKSVDDLAQSVIPGDRSAPIPLTIGDVADVRLGGPLAKRGDAGVNGKPAVILSIQKQPGASTIQLTDAIQADLEKIQATLPEGVKIHAEIFRQSEFIHRAISNVEEALRDGSILVVIVLFLFLLNFRTTFITLTAIPLSMIITAIVFHLFGMSINTMTLGGLAIAIGELVDDAIVDVENVFRRLRENRHAAQPKPALEVIYHASSEVRNSIVFATIIVVLVFIPLFALGGIEGRIFAPLGIAYITSIISSLFVAVTVTPALCSYLLPKMKRMDHEKDSWLVRKIKGAEARLLDWAVPRTTPILLLVALAFLAALAVIPFFGREFLPPFNEGSVTINLASAPGISLKESNRIGALAEKLILEVPEVSMTGRRTGRAELDDHAEGVHSSEIEVELKPSDRARGVILDDIRTRLDQIPGIAVNLGQPISHRIDHLLSGVRAQIAVKLFGDDLTTLREKAEEIRSVMSTVPGVVDLQVEKQVLIPQLHVNIDRQQAKKYGVMAGEVAEYGELAMNGRSVGQILEEQRTYDLVMRLTDEARNDLDAIKRIPIDTVAGQVLPLGVLANVEEAKGPNIINRENVRRRIVIQANVSERDLVSAVSEIQQRLGTEVKLPEGYFVTYGGQFESQASASRLIAILSLFSLAGMFIVLYAHFRSVMFAIQIMLNIPMAFIGSVIGVLLMGGTLSIATMVGFITLTGIAARNGIMMISHYLHLMEHEGEKFDLKMIVRGTQERLVPVLMTALTAALALVPLVIAAGQPGREILHPVAVVIFSGIFSSTLLDFIVTPLVFWRFGRKSVAKLLPQAVV